jgi:hypothetical protein
MIKAMLLTSLIGLAGCGNVVGPVYGSSAGMPARPAPDAASQGHVEAPHSNPKMDGPPGALGE